MAAGSGRAGGLPQVGEGASAPWGAPGTALAGAAAPPPPPSLPPRVGARLALPALVSRGLALCGFFRVFLNFSLTRLPL